MSLVCNCKACKYFYRSRLIYNVDCDHAMITEEEINKYLLNADEVCPYFEKRVTEQVLIH